MSNNRLPMFTNLPLGTHWEQYEWPEYILVSHEKFQSSMKKYVPERTCTCEGSIFEDCFGLFIHDLSCGHVAATFSSEPPNYCEECGARVVGD